MFTCIHLGWYPPSNPRRSFIFAAKEIIMGCWSETCGISQLPIHDGSEAVLIYLVNYPFGKGGGRLCYVSDAYVPASLPIHGTYDDYGCLEFDASSPENAPGVLSVNMLMKAAGFTGTLEEFQGESMQGNVSYPSPYRSDVVCHVTPVLILKDVWNYVTDPTNTQRDFDPHGWNNISKDDHVNAGSEQLISMRDFMQAGDAFAMIWHRPSYRKPGIGRFVESGSPYINLRSSDILYKWMDHPEIPAEAMSRAICDMTDLHTFMSHNRKAWHLTAGSGSQDENYDGAIAFHRQMASIAEKIDQRQRAEYGEFNEEVESQ